MERAKNTVARRAFGAASVVAGLGLWAMMVGVAMLVLDRNVLQRGMPWIYDLLIWLLIATVYLGAVRVSWRHDHISMDALLIRMPPGLRKLVDLATAVLTIAFSVYLVVLAWPQLEVTLSSGQTTSSGMFPAWIGHVILPACFLLISLAYMAYFSYRVRGDRSEPEPDVDDSDSMARRGV